MAFGFLSGISLAKVKYHSGSSSHRLQKRVSSCRTIVKNNSQMVFLSRLTIFL
jgi:hypothetical protein